MTLEIDPGSFKTKRSRAPQGSHEVSGAPSNTGEILADAERRLRRAGISEARLDAELILSHILRVDRVQLHAHPTAAVPTPAVEQFRAKVEERRGGRPLAQILGCKEFYGLGFEINNQVLIPRPETELLVEWGIEEVQSKTPPGGASGIRIADLGTGSGCVAVCWAVHLPGVIVDAVDISSSALEVARRNALRHGVAGRIRFYLGDLVGPLEGTYPLIAANPPYVAVNDPRLDPQVRAHEPAVALFDPYEGDGLGFYRRLAREALPSIAPGGSLILELAEGQGEEVLNIFTEVASLRHEFRLDLAGIVRALRLTRE